MSDGAKAEGDGGRLCNRASGRGESTAGNKKPLKRSRKCTVVKEIDIFFYEPFASVDNDLRNDFHGSTKVAKLA